ncbi:MAG: phage tail protein [Rhodospirillaceae bacterium]
MTTPYMGEIRMFGGNFAPHNWGFCSGAIVAVSDYHALFSLIGAQYGGNGISNFGLPDLRGRIPLHHGDGPGLTPRIVGQMLGYETISLTSNQMPAHTHYLAVSANPPSDTTCAGNTLGKGRFYEDPPGAAAAGPMLTGTIGDEGDGDAHQNMMPSLAINFILALNGAYPSRN